MRKGGALLPDDTTRRATLAACIAACPRGAAAASNSEEEPEFICAAQCLAQQTPFSPTGAALLQCAVEQQQQKLPDIGKNVNEEEKVQPQPASSALGGLKGQGFEAIREAHNEDATFED